MTVPDLAPVLPDLDALDAATGRLLATVEALTDAELALPSLLPGWTRLHVLTHLARNADGMRNRLLEVRTGRPVAQYASNELRAADIEVGAQRPAELVRQDLTSACERFAIDARSIEPAAWRGTIEGYDAEPVPATTAVERRI